MKEIILKNISPLGHPLEATFAPDRGMNLLSYKLEKIEVIDQATRSLFDERFAGLGALIGPHFHHRKEIPSNFDTSLFPHIAKAMAQGGKEPFSHGIARYVPWKFVASSTQIKGRLRGDDLYKGIPLKALEGQDFNMTFEARLLTDGLFIEYKVDSQHPSVLGLHYYYKLNKAGFIYGAIQNTYRDQTEWRPLPSEWTQNNHLHFPLPQEADFGFIPETPPLTDHNYHMNLNTPEYSLHIDYNTASDTEISCQIFHPKDATYVCVEPITARFPLAPILTRSTLEAKLQIFAP